MATVSPAISLIPSQAGAVPRVTWAGIVTGDTLDALALPGSTSAASVQFSGTFGGATVKLQASNDGTTFYDMKDASGTTISATAGAYFEFSTAAVYIRPSIASGSANSVNAIVRLRG